MALSMDRVIGFDRLWLPLPVRLGYRAFLSPSRRVTGWLPPASTPPAGSRAFFPRRISRRSLPWRELYLPSGRLTTCIPTACGQLQGLHRHRGRFFPLGVTWCKARYTHTTFCHISVAQKYFYKKAFVYVIRSYKPPVDQGLCATLAFFPRSSASGRMK